MIQFNPHQQTLLQLLADGHCHNGNALGKALGVSRSAVWKHINLLIDLGVPITRIPQKGYQLLNPLILLDKELIAKHLQSIGCTTPFNLHLFASLDSTNRYLKELPTNALLDICCAEIQTHGRGRFGRHWYSPFGENLYCSSRWNLNCDLSKLSGLSLVTSLAILNTLNEFIPSAAIKVKWPNDLIWNHKKLCGNLIEILAESNSNAQVIIGIGININTDTKIHSLPDKPWCSLYEITEQHYDRNGILASLISNLERYLNQFIVQGLGAFTEEWNNYDYLKGKSITVTQSSNTISGIALGINQEGLLILEDSLGTKHYLSSGDTSLQPAASANYRFRHSSLLA